MGVSCLGLTGTDWLLVTVLGVMVVIYIVRTYWVLTAMRCTVVVLFVFEPDVSDCVLGCDSGPTDCDWYA